MNINQAKAVAGIKKPLQSKQDFQWAQKECKSLIVKARQEEDIERAKQLSEAKAFFKRRSLKKGCEKCDQTITRGATLCRTCLRSKAQALPLPPGFEAGQSLKRKTKTRIDNNPKGGSLARMGYYAREVQNVVNRWRAIIPEDWMRYYFRIISDSALHGTDFNLRLVPREWLPLVGEFCLAIGKLATDKTNINHWLIKLPISVAVSGSWLTWDEIREQIIKAGGPTFKVGALKNSYSKLQITTVR